MRPTGFVGVVVFTGVFGVDFTLRTTGSRAHGFERAFAIGALVFWTREAQSAFVSRAAAFAASMHSRAVVSVVALRFERALTISALVFWTREAQSGFVCRAAAFAASGLSTFGCRLS